MPPSRLSVSPALRRRLHWAGSLLAVAGIGFVAVRLRSSWSTLDLSAIGAVDWAWIALLSLTYGAANLCLASAWWHLLRHFGAQERRIDAIRLYGISQLAKYLPGNVFHLAGRQALGMSAGIPAGILARSMLWELTSIGVAGALFGWLVLPRLLPALPVPAAVLLMLASSVVLLNLLRSRASTHASLALLWQLCFLTISAGVFVSLVDRLGGLDGGASSWLLIGGAYVFAWLVGLVTPGAPAGAGVREMILLAVLKDTTADTGLLLAVLFGRIVTVLGDLWFFTGAALSARSK
jgi:uncharacterized membrane protein YbhN (UPF0104 family)